MLDRDALAEDLIVPDAGVGREARGVVVLAIVAAWSLACGSTPPPPPAALREVPATELRNAGEFEVIADRAARSRALFAEASRVFLHPRCVNCHPSGDVPHQGMQLAPHDPPVVRGPADRGVVGMECGTCHQDQNQPLTRVPGAPGWHLAPLGMAWVGRSPRQICEQLKDPARNGSRTLAQIVEHATHDVLVAWGWAPGAGREPPPGTQPQFGALVAAWVATGAECPEENAR